MIYTNEEVNYPFFYYFCLFFPTFLFLPAACLLATAAASCLGFLPSLAQEFFYFFRTFSSVCMNQVGRMEKRIYRELESNWMDMGKGGGWLLLHAGCVM